MKYINKQWFTLVELIVVITILAILWSIAFLSLQSYGSDARNSKRVTDLNSIQKAISAKQTSWINISAFVNPVDNSKVFPFSIGWQALAVDSPYYTAWTVNYNALGMKETDFQDPQTNNPYVAWITTLAGWVYQIAASMEQSGLSKVARVIWNWNPRPKTNTAFTSTWTIIVLSGATDISKFRLTDIVDLDGEGTWTATWTVIKVSTDQMTLTLSTGSTTTGITLAAAESAGLIDAASATTGFVVDGWAVLPY